MDPREAESLVVPLYFSLPLACITVRHGSPSRKHAATIRLSTLAMHLGGRLEHMTTRVCLPRVGGTCLSLFEWDMLAVSTDHSKQVHQTCRRTQFVVLGQGESSRARFGGAFTLFRRRSVGRVPTAKKKRLGHSGWVRD